MSSNGTSAIKLTSLKVATPYKIVSMRLLDGKFGTSWFLRVRESGKIVEQDVYGNKLV
jgi:hypothetical protein